jgi:hypothetical protein
MAAVVPASGFLSYYTKGAFNQISTSNIGKLWTIIANQVDELETQIALLKDIFHLQSQVGINLDKIGSVLNKTRPAGKSDDEYRLDLITAIIQETSTATIPELVSLGKIVAGNTNEAAFRPFEMYLLSASPLLLDASRVLDGTIPMSPDTKRYASVDCRIEGQIDDLKVPIKVAEAIGKIRGAGIGTVFTMVFKILMSGMTLYSGDRNFPIEIALGDGATRDPLPADTGLQNEVYRKAVNTQILANGDWDYYVISATTELNAYTINEAALFDKNGLMIAKYVFEGIEKNSSLVNEYHIIDDL